MKKIRVLIAEDHTIVRQGLSALLRAEPDIEVVGEASDGLEAIEMAKKLIPDVVLMDIAHAEFERIGSHPSDQETLSPDEGVGPHDV